MTRGRLSLLSLVVVAAAAVMAVRIARSPASEPSTGASGETTSASRVGGGRPSDLVLLVLDTRAGPFAAVVGAGGSSAPGAITCFTLSHMRFSCAGSLASAFQKLLIQSTPRVRMMSS